MNHSKLYVPDPSLWINFFKQKTSKRIINQKGGKNTSETEPINVELVSPVEAADERAESAMKRVVRKKRRVIKRRKKRINKKKRTKSSSHKRKASKKRSKPRRSVKKRDIFHR